MYESKLCVVIAADYRICAEISDESILVSTSILAGFFEVNAYRKASDLSPRSQCLFRTGCFSLRLFVGRFAASSLVALSKILRTRWRPLLQFANKMLYCAFCTCMYVFVKAEEALPDARRCILGRSEAGSVFGLGMSLCS